jgi:hypothetical protein
MDAVFKEDVLQTAARGRSVHELIDECFEKVGDEKASK